MAFTLERFAATRPFVFHVTAPENIVSIVEQRLLLTAAELIRRSGDTTWLRVRRQHAVTLRGGPVAVVLRDQAPLKTANAALAAGWTEADWVEHQNERVFFWPGTDGGPIVNGQQLLAKLEREGAAVLRVPTLDLFAANARQLPQFSRWNSGAPRKNNGRPIPRGPETFANADGFPGPPSGVVELGYEGAVTLPATTDLRCDEGQWKPVFLD